MHPALPYLMHPKQLIQSLSLSLALTVSSMAFAAGANPIIVGQSIDLSGPNADIGRDYVAGIKTCFDMVNASGGIGGRKIQYVVHDDRGQASLAAEAATELLDRGQADVLMGGVGDASMDAVLNTNAFRRSGLVLFAPLAAADHVRDARVMYWRPSYRQELRHIFSHFGKLGMKEVGIVFQDTASNQEAYKNLAVEVRDHGMKLTGIVRIGIQGAQAEQIRKEAEKLAASRPGFVLVVADTIGTALFLREYRKLDRQTFVAGTSLTNLTTLRELAGPQAVEWTVFSQVVPNPNAGTSLLQVEHMNMMRKYRDESLSALTLEGFVAAKALVKVLRNSRRGPRNALQELAAQEGEIDLGGMTITTGANSNRLSSYLDIALFKKGSSLMF
ncbi:ABC transporter substrate-binding protein [Herbaspirillum sp. GCM10030257]|uniref:ABC transporter substrate-binding protein n=1 Tax=Herbaspirillum sp. GCM10030257 TaxID=3273393 RepID=UPI0036109EF5